jgi:23S rRNA (adenine2503-C2)-methyltransferase
MQDKNYINIKDLSPQEIEDFVLDNNSKPFRARQISKWLYKKGVGCFDDMSDLSKDFRDLLEFSFSLEPSLELEQEQVSEDGTKKYLFKLSDGNQIESVLIPDKSRNTLCISSQVGCALGCTFCMTGTVGKIRNLRPSEILDQYLLVNKYNENAITNIVFMGMGEPLDNLENLVKVINVLTDPNYLALSPKRITVSTSGLVPQIKKLGEQVSVNLAVSLNAPSDELRDEIMPINKRYPIKELLEASINFPVPNRKYLMFEYVLLKDVNDSDIDAHTLGKLLRGIKCKINIIPFNEAYPLPYKSPSWDRVLKFQEILISYRINVRIRKSRGSDSLGACGQLAATYPSIKVKEPQAQI